MDDISARASSLDAEASALVETLPVLPPDRLDGMIADATALADALDGEASELATTLARLIAVYRDGRAVLEGWALVASAAHTLARALIDTPVITASRMDAKSNEATRDIGAGAGTRDARAPEVPTTTLGNGAQGLDVRTSEVLTDAQTDDAQTNDAQTNDAQTNDAQTNDAQTNDAQTNDARTDNAQNHDVQSDHALALARAASPRAGGSEGAAGGSEGAAGASEGAAGASEGAAGARPRADGRHRAALVAARFELETLMPRAGAVPVVRAPDVPLASLRRRT